MLFYFHNSRQLLYKRIRGLLVFSYQVIKDLAWGKRTFHRDNNICDMVYVLSDYYCCCCYEN